MCAATTLSWWIGRIVLSTLVVNDGLADRVKASLVRLLALLLIVLVGEHLKHQLGRWVSLSIAFALFLMKNIFCETHAKVWLLKKYSPHFFSLILRYSFWCWVHKWYSFLNKDGFSSSYHYAKVSTLSQSRQKFVTNLFGYRLYLVFYKNFVKKHTICRTDDQQLLY